LRLDFHILYAWNTKKRKLEIIFRLLHDHVLCVFQAKHPNANNHTIFCFRFGVQPQLQALLDHNHKHISREYGASNCLSFQLAKQSNDETFFQSNHIFVFENL